MTTPYGLLDMNAEALQAQLGATAGERATPNPPPTLRARVLGGARDALERVRGVLAPVPEGYEGLLTPEQIQAARPSLLGSIIGRPDGSSSYEARLDRQVGRQMATEGVQNARAAQAQQQEILARRAQVGTDFQPKPGESVQDTVNRLKQMYAAYVAAGDTEMIGKLGEVLKSWGNDANRAALQRTDAGDRWVLTDPYNGTIVGTIPKAPEPASPTPPRPNNPPTPAQAVQTERSLRGDFFANKQVQDAQGIARGLTAARAALALNTPISDLQAIIAMTKIFDPGSVAREGEVQLTMSATDLPDRVRLFINRYNAAPLVDPNNPNAGRKLTDAQKRDMRQLIDELEKQAKGLVAPIQQSFGAQVRRYNNQFGFGLDSATIAPDVFENSAAAPGLLGGALSPAATPTAPLARPNPLLNPRRP